MTENLPAPYRIGIDARFFQAETGGIGRYTRELIHHLALLDQYNQYTVFLSEKGVAEWTLNQPNFHPKLVEAPYYSYAEQTKFLAELNKENLDLVHFLNFNHPVLYLKPFVTTLHDLTVYFHPVGRSQKSKLRRMAFVLTLTRALRRARRVIAISEHTALDAEKHLRIPQAKMEVIYEGGPAPVELPFGSKAIIQDYLGSRDPYFLFVSQWRPHKGIITLIEAFGKFKAATGLPHKLVLLGKQKVLAEEVRQALFLSPVSEEIITPGFAPEELLPGLYRHAAAHVLPSEYEGFGLTPLEAFAYGTPVISARNSSLPEVVGQAGLFFETRNAEELALRLQEVATNPALAAELVAKGSVQLKKFSWELMARRTLDLYLGVLEKHR